MNDPLIFRFTAPGRLRFFGVLFLVLWVGIFIVHHALATSLLDKDSRNVIGRDFLAFYAAGKIVLEHNTNALYDEDTQIAAQAAVLAPETQRGFYYYINPVPVAVIYSLFARLPYLPAFYLHTAFMFACFWIGMWVLRPRLPALRSFWLTAALLGVTWMPMMHAITAGQNTSLTFLLLAVVYVATTANRQWLAGLALGLQFFKPQYALPLLGLLLLRRQLVTVAVAVAVAAVYHLLGALHSDWGWPGMMLEASAGYFQEQGRLVQGPTHISFLEVVDYSIIQPLERATASPLLIRGIRTSAWLAVVVFAGYLILAWRRAVPSAGCFRSYYALAVAGSVLISPHAHYYDIAILLLPLLLILEERALATQPLGAGLRALFIAGYLGYPAIILLHVSEKIGFQPAFALLLWFVCWCAGHVRNLKRWVRDASGGDSE